MFNINLIVQNNLIRNAGVVREIIVHISVTDWIPEISTAQKIEDEFNRIRQFENPTERSLELMLSVGQYFEDGNKRTTQLLANHELIRNGCGIISIHVEKRIEFSTLLVDFYETNRRKKLKTFLYDTCISGFTRKNKLLFPSRMKRIELLLKVFL